MSPTIELPSPAICVWCINQYKERCISQCAPEGKFRYLEPSSLEQWEMPPALPPFRELLQMSGHEKLAILYLGLFYLHWMETKEV
ncbi:MAG: hypothetical protein EXR62_07660 [Chloroflexi bacterium]|nr:hypothetical protein [Chloroflexota bacterium]